MADLAEMNAHDIMENTQRNLLRDAGIVRQRIGYQVSIEQVYHHLEVAMDHENRIDLVVEDLLERINNGEFGEVRPTTSREDATEPAAENTIDNENSIEPSESLAYVAEDDSEMDDDEDSRPRSNKRKVVEARKEQAAASDDSREVESILDGQLEQIGGAAEQEEMPANFNAKMELDLENLASLFPNRPLDEMRDMYLSIFQIEKDNTVNMLAQQLYDAEDLASPPKRPRIDQNVQDRAGPSGLAPAKLMLLDEICHILPDIARQDLELKCVEYDWNENLIGTFVAQQLQIRTGIADADAGAQDFRPQSPQPGPSNEQEDGDVTEEPVDPPEVTERVAQLIGMFPNTDPEFLRHKVLETLEQPEEYSAFVNAAIEGQSMPTRKEFEERKKKEEDFKKYTQRMSVEEFLKHFPNPQEHFEAKTVGQNDELYKELCQSFLSSHFSRISKKKILQIFHLSYNLTKAFDALQREPNQIKNRRSRYQEAPTQTQHLHFLQEVTYLKMKEDIKRYYKNKEEERKRAIERARAKNELVECPVCCEDECLFEDMTACADGHLFCKNCIKQYAETAIGDNKTQFPCIEGNCASSFPLQTLKTVLDAKAFTCLLRRMQSEEIRAANIQDLESCPFCDYSYIPDENNALFECQADTCKKVSCRKCKELNHLPLRCEEVEKDAESRLRKEIEERMTNVLIRECYKCQNKFIKSDGCNKMTCSRCGSKMCYLCRQPIRDYDHFYQGPQGGPNPNGSCPLYSNNDELHVRQVIEEGEKAKKEAEAKGLTLKHDPTKIKPKETGGGLPHHGHMPINFLGQVQDEVLRRLANIHWQQHQIHQPQPEIAELGMDQLNDYVMRMWGPDNAPGAAAQPPANANLPRADNAPVAVAPPAAQQAAPEPAPPAHVNPPPAAPQAWVGQGQRRYNVLVGRLQVLNGAVQFLAGQHQNQDQQRNALNRLRRLIELTENELRNVNGGNPPANVQNAVQFNTPYEVYNALANQQRAIREEMIRRQIVRRLVQVRQDRRIGQERRANVAPPHQAGLRIYFDPADRAGGYQVQGLNMQFPGMGNPNWRIFRAAPQNAPQPPPPQMHVPLANEAFRPLRRINHQDGTFSYRVEVEVRNPTAVRAQNQQQQAAANNAPRQVRHNLFPEQPVEPPAPAPPVPQTPAQRAGAFFATLPFRETPRLTTDAARRLPPLDRARYSIERCHRAMDMLENSRLLNPMGEPGNIEISNFKKMYTIIKKLKEEAKDSAELEEHMLFLNNRFNALIENHKGFKALKKEIKQQRKNEKSAKRSEAAGTSAEGDQSGAGPSTRPNNDDQDGGGNNSPDSDDYVNNFQFDD
ncbi:uncharacterized protein LOC132194979 isoform X2 [Neocloeon triangulifer]|nr:uncharacterized protein LOC132194979 isoform X2 [Neocloeon triangulifer]